MNEEERTDESLLRMFDSCPASMSNHSRATRIAIAFCLSGASDYEIARVRAWVLYLVNTRVPKAAV